MKILLINKVHIGIKDSLLLFWCVYFPFSVLMPFTDIYCQDLEENLHL